METDNIPDIVSLNFTQLATAMTEKSLAIPTKEYSVVEMANILNTLASNVGLTLDNYLMQYILSGSNYVLVEATAGSGKTTISQFKIIGEKIFYKTRGSRILCLAYNDHSKTDMEVRHEELTQRLNSLGFTDLQIDSDLVCKTFHGNARAWVAQFKDKLGIFDVKNMLLDEENEGEITRGISQSINVSAKKFNVEIEITSSLINTISSISSYMREMCWGSDRLVDIKEFVDLGISVEVMTSILEKYTFWKKLNGKLDYTDFLFKFYELLRDHSDAREYIQRAYHYIMFDEYQDSTELMNRCLSLMVLPTTKVNCVGDGDQSVYGFRGTSSTNCIDFRDRFPGGKVFTMGKNRRCPKNVLAVGIRIISANELRYAKEIYTDKPGGTVSNFLYKSSRDEILSIKNQLVTLNLEDLTETCIAYRNKESSYLLTRYLLRENIPYRLSSGYHPYSDVLSKNLHAIFDFLERPWSVTHQMKALRRLLPKVTDKVVARLAKEYTDKRDAELFERQKERVEFHKNKEEFDLNNAEDMDFLSGESTVSDMDTHWTKYDWSEYENIRYFARAKEIILMCEQYVKDKKPMNTFFPVLFGVFKYYFWDFVKEKVHFNQQLEDDILSEYLVDDTYPIFKQTRSVLTERLKKFKKSGLQGKGVTVTTFHKLKGLEFDTQMLMDLDEDIFPNFKKIDASKYTNDLKQQEKEEATRLMFVAVTRAKKNLIMFWHEDRPSVFYDAVKDLSTEVQLEGLLTKDVKSSLKLNPNITSTSPVKELEMDLDLMEDDENSATTSDTSNKTGVKYGKILEESVSPLSNQANAHGKDKVNKVMSLLKGMKDAK